MQSTIVLRELYNKMQANIPFDSFVEMMSPYILDPLTNWYNRQTYSDQLPSIVNDMFDASKKIEKSSDDNVYTLLFADINNLKSVNDKKGYEFGDEGIRQITSIISKHLKDFEDSMFCFRTGGDEFTIIIPNCSRQTVVPYIQLIETEIALSSEKLNSMSVAIGIEDTKDVIPSKRETPIVKQLFYRTVKYFAEERMKIRKTDIKEQGFNKENFFNEIFRNFDSSYARLLGKKSLDEDEKVELYAGLLNYITDSQNRKNSVSNDSTSKIHPTQADERD